MKIYFLLNPSKAKNRWDWREIAAQNAKRFGWTPRFGEIDRLLPHAVDRLLAQAVEEGCTRIVVVGGDGSLHRVVNVLYRMNRLPSTEIAVVPAGTCNDFARFLGFRRRRLENAFRAACSGKAHPTDLGVMDNELFVNNAGFGRQPSASKKRWKTSFQALRKFRPTGLRARWDKGSIEGAFYMALVCNGPFFSGGLHFSKNISITDGLLDVYLIPAMPKWRLVSLLALGRLGRPARSKRLLTIRVPRVDIEAEADIWPQADGEPPAKAVRRVIFSVSPEKAMIVAP